MYFNSFLVQEKAAIKGKLEQNPVFNWLISVMIFQMIISPVIDAINDTTFWYTFIERDLKGLMNWRMQFEWHEILPDERARKVQKLIDARYK